MLLTVFKIGSAAYAVDATKLVEVLPLVHVEPIPHAQAAIAGAINYHGTPIIVIDLNRLAGAAPAVRLLSTRILVVQQASTKLGLVAAGATDTVKIDASAFRHDTDVAVGPVDWVGPRAVYGSGFIQRLELEPLVRMIGVAA